MKNPILPFLNPVKLTQAYLYNRKSCKYNKSADDLELKLYSKIFRNDMIHYGYFDDIDITPEFISIGLFENAQRRYAEIIVEQIKDKKCCVLDVGCGMGGLSYYLLNSGFMVEALTPNKNQSKYIERMDHTLQCHNCKFESFSTDTKFGTVINSESLQYIPLDDAFERVERIITPDGRWIVTDCFQIKDHAQRKSVHALELFYQKAKEHSWNIIYERDITLNVLPTLKMVNVYVDRFLIPLSDYAEEKLKYKKAWLYYLTEQTRNSITGKLKKQVSLIDPEIFIAEKKYMLFVLENHRF